ncbi:MAG: hypothetical protein RLY86_2072 [Pseudomonadota bacterium]
MNMAESTTQAGQEGADSNLICVNDQGLSEVAMRRVLSPFSNSRHFVGVVEAATKLESGTVDADLDDDFAHFAKAAVQG